MKLIVYHIHKKIKGFQADGVFGAFIKGWGWATIHAWNMNEKKDIKGKSIKLSKNGKVLYSQLVGQNVGDSSTISAQLIEIVKFLF